MILRIDTDRNTVSLTDIDDLKHLSAEVSGEGDIDQALGTFGAIDDDGAHLWISVDALRKAAMPAHDTDWSGRFDAMIGYADSKGWIDASHARVRVHIFLS